MIEDDPRIDPADLRQVRFSGSFRRYDAKAVDDFLESIAGRIAATNSVVDDLRRELEAARAERSEPTEDRSPFDAPDLAGLSEDELVQLVGEETAHVLSIARKAASDIRAKAEDAAARLIREATAEAAQVTEEATAAAAAMTAEAASARDTAVAAAEEDAERIRAAASSDADEVVTAARQEAEAIDRVAAEVRQAAEEDAERIIEEAKDEGRAMVAEAKKVRARVLEDLQRRRDLGRSQVERLAAGRDQLLAAYAAVRANLDEITSKLEVGLLEAGSSPDPLLEDGFAGIVISGLDDEPDDEPDDEVDAEPDDEPDDETAGTADATDDEPSTTTTDAEPRPEAEPDDAAPIDPDDAAPDAEVASDPSTAAEAEPGETVAPDDHADAARDDDGGDTDGGDTDVDALFAKIRSERAESVARAQRVLAGDESEATDAPEPQEDGAAAEPTSVEVPAPDEADDPGSQTGSDQVPAELLAAPAALAERAEVVDPLDKKLARALKRHLADEQNEVLDVLRRSESTVLDDLLPPLEDHVAGYARVAAAHLGAAARAGADHAGGEADVDVTGLANELGTALIEPFRRRIERSAAEVEGDADALDERLRALYREWKVEHIGAATTDSLLSAYALGQHAAAPDGAHLRWLIDPGQGPCPDAQDNALAGAVAKGEPFPTGDECPQAHPGCRCLLVVES